MDHQAPNVTPEATVLTIAATRLALTGECGSDPFPPIYSSFLHGDNRADLSAEIIAAGSDTSLMALSPGSNFPPWEFFASGNSCKVVRRRQTGEILWQMEGGSDFSTARVAWHPNLFEENYGSYRAAWSTGMGFLALGLRLRRAGGFMMHGAAAIIDDTGIICSGVSGAGKSTISRLLETNGAKVLSDERCVVRRNSANTGFDVHGTPWPSSAGLGLNKSAPLKRLYFLAHGTTEKLTPLAPREALRRLIPVTMIAWQTPALLDPWLATVESLVTSTPCALLEFRPTAAVVPFLQRDLLR